MVEKSTESLISQSVSNKLHKRLWISLITGLVFTCILMGSFFTYNSYQSFSEQLEKQLLYDLELGAIALNSEVFRLENLTAQITSRSSIRVALEKFTQGEIDLESLIQFSVPKLNDAMRLSPEIIGISRLTVDGNRLIQVGQSVPSLLWPENYLSETIQLGIPQLFQNKQIMVVSAPITNSKNHVVGIDLVAFDVQNIMKIVHGFAQRNHNSGRGQIGANLSNDVKYFFHFGSTSQQLNEDLIDQEVYKTFSNAMQNSHILEDIEGVVIGRKKIGKSNWVFLFYEDRDSFYDVAQSHAAHVGFSVLLMTIMGGVLTSLLVKPLTGRILVAAKDLHRLLDDHNLLLQQAQYNEERLQAILDNTTSVIYLKDQEGKYLLVNNSYLKLFDLSPDQIIGKTDHDIFPAEIADVFKENDLKVFEGGVPFELDEQAPQADGIHDYISIKFPLHDALGKIYGICGISTDITERKLNEEALRVSEERFTLAMKASNDGLWDWNLETNEVYFSPRWKLMLGYENHELENEFSTWEELVDLEGRGKTQALIEQCINETKNSFSTDFRMRHKDGHWVDIFSRGIVVRNEKGQPIRMVGTHVDISARKQLESQLSDSEARANLIINTSPDAIIMTDSSAIIVSTNPQTTSLFGFDKNELLGQAIETLFPKHQHDKYFYFYKANITNSSPQNSRANSNIMLLEGLKKSGYEFPIETSLSSILINRQRHYVITIRDISERIEAQKELNDSNLRFRTLFELSPDPAWIIDEHHFVECNQAAVTLLGYSSKDEILNTHPSELSPERQADGQESFKKAERMMNIAQQKGFNRFEWIHVKKDKSEFFAEVTLSVIAMQNRKVIYCAWRDITDRKKAELELDAYQNNLEVLVKERTVKLEDITAYNRTLFEKSPTGLVLCNMNGELIDINPAFLMIVGYTEAEAKKLSYWDLTPMDYEPMEKKQLELLEKTQRYGPYEKEYIHKDGYRVPVCLNGLLIEQGGQTYIWSSVENITQSKKLQAELEQARDNAEHLAQVKSEFLANMSHEIRTPMNSIIGMTHLALQTDLNDKQENYVKKANSSAKNLLGILNDILDFSKIEASKLELEVIDFNLIDVINHLQDIIGLKAREKALKISTEIEENVPRALMGDPLRLGQVLINLGSNAVKFSEAGDSIILKVALLEQNQHEVVLHFSVQDTGIGMTKEQQGKLFQSFSQADNSTTRQYGGTGLGLAISQQIIYMMNGEIWVQSESGVGSIFQFTVPLQTQSKHKESQVISEPEKPNHAGAIDSLKNAKILLVEDNEINQEIACELFEMEGMTLEIANHGEEALALLETHDYDGILMDCQMPVMDGFEATRKIREQPKYKDLPIIAMTANVMKEDIEKVLAVGMNDHIGKPIDPNLLFDIMAKWIKQDLD